MHPAALDVRRIGIGMLGYGFMGKVHSNAYLKIPYSFQVAGGLSRPGGHLRPG